jgi:D-sedoheptulose 7-phosphate isomerase
MKTTILSSLKESLEVKERVLKDITPIIDAVNLIWERIDNGGKLIVMGNGGSAADAQHIAAELVGRFEKERSPIPAISLTTDTSAITSISNDYGFDEVFARQLAALISDKDVILAISTSGNSPNVLKAAHYAREMGVPVVGLLGRDGGKIKEISNISIIVPSYRTPRIQEAHITIGHIICEIIEKNWMKNKKNYAGNQESVSYK